MFSLLCTHIAGDSSLVPTSILSAHSSHVCKRSIALYLPFPLFMPNQFQLTNLLKMVLRPVKCTCEATKDSFMKVIGHPEFWL